MIKSELLQRKEILVTKRLVSVLCGLSLTLIFSNIAFSEQIKMENGNEGEWIEFAPNGIISMQMNKSIKAIGKYYKVSFKSEYPNKSKSLQTFLIDCKKHKFKVMSYEGFDNKGNVDGVRSESKVWIYLVLLKLTNWLQLKHVQI